MVENYAIHLYNRALKLSKEQNHNEAIKLLCNAIQLKPDDFHMLNLVGLCYYQIGLSHIASQCFTASLQVEQGSVNPATEYQKQVDKYIKESTIVFTEVFSYVFDKNFKDAYKLLNKYRCEKGLKFQYVLNLEGILAFLAGNYGKAKEAWLASLCECTSANVATEYLIELYKTEINTNTESVFIKTLKSFYFRIKKELNV